MKLEKAKNPTEAKNTELVINRRFIYRPSIARPYRVNKRVYRSGKDRHTRVGYVPPKEKR